MNLEIAVLLIARGHMKRAQQLEQYAEWLGGDVEYLLRPWQRQFIIVNVCIPRPFEAHHVENLKAYSIEIQSFEVRVWAAPKGWRPRAPQRQDLGYMEQL